MNPQTVGNSLPEAVTCGVNFGTGIVIMKRIAALILCCALTLSMVTALAEEDVEDFNTWLFKCGRIIPLTTLIARDPFSPFENHIFPMEVLRGVSAECAGCSGTPVNSLARSLIGNDMRSSPEYYIPPGDGSLCSVRPKKRRPGSWKLCCVQSYVVIPSLLYEWNCHQ